MSTVDPEPSEEHVSSLAAAWDEALAAGVPAPPLPALRDNPEMQPHLLRGLACMQVLRQVWPRPRSRAGTPTPLTVDEGPASPVPQPLVAGYEIVEELGRGGMGVVYKAFDPRLRRLVALKRLHSDKALPRFRTEAEAIARLQHPNIVQIHEIGEANGGPYLVLEYLAGGSLAQQLDGKPQPARESAALIATLARAAHYAHTQGIVHRDLKPANVLLQIADCRLQIEQQSAICNLQSAIPKIADFGLAKRLDEGPGPTQHGDILGTPSYMAPEQASGSVHEIGPATDVYSLGVILYELLTGRTPFIGSGPLETLMLIRTVEPVPPRRLQPKVPRDLETISLKCLHKEPARRYASAEDLAEDLRRFLEGRPILARPVGTPERLRRWCRRNPLSAALSAALVLALLGGLAGLTGLWLHAAAQRDRAEANLNLAKKAVDDCFVLATENELFQPENMRRVQGLLLQRALPFYQDFQVQRQADPTLLAEQAHNFHRVAIITGLLGSHVEAAEAGERAVALWNDLATASPAVSTHRQELARALHRLGVARHFLGQSAPAQACFERARDLQEDLVRAHPAADVYRKHLAATYTDLGHLQRALGQAEAAVRSYERARDLQEALLKRDPKSQVDRHNLALTCSRLGGLQQSLGQLEAARGNLERALALQGPLAAEFPHVGPFQHDLATTHGSLSSLHSARGQPAEAVRAQERARDILEKLVVAYPDTTDYQGALASAYVGLSAAHFHRGAGEAARRAGDQARAAFEKLARAYPTAVAYEYGLAEALSAAGVAREQLGEIEPARQLQEQALAIAEKLVRAQPDLVAHRLFLAGTLVNLGHLAFDRGDGAGAVTRYDRAIELLEGLGLRQAEAVQVRTFLRNAWNRRAEALHRLGRYAEALPAWDRALALDAGGRRTNIRLGRAATLTRLGDHAAGRALADEISRAKKLPADELYDLAGLWAVLAAEISKDARLAEADRARRAEEAAVRAVELVRRTLRNGYPNLAHLQRDPNLEALRSRSDFSALLKEQETRAPEKNAPPGK
jgi:serine/threonine protein kinase